jgi:hypothetical protein
MASYIPVGHRYLWNKRHRDECIWKEGSVLQSVNNFCTLQCKYSVKVKVKFTLEQAMKAQRGSKGIALFFL